jgi:hypothetical protein
MKLELELNPPGIIFLPTSSSQIKMIESMTMLQGTTAVRIVFSSYSSGKKFLMSLHRSSRRCIIVLTSSLVLLL